MVHGLTCAPTRSPGGPSRALPTAGPTPLVRQAEAGPPPPARRLPRTRQPRTRPARPRPCASGSGLVRVGLGSGCAPHAPSTATPLCVWSGACDRPHVQFRLPQRAARQPSSTQLAADSPSWPHPQPAPMGPNPLALIHSSYRQRAAAAVGARWSLPSSLFCTSIRLHLRGGRLPFMQLHLPIIQQAASRVEKMGLTCPPPGARGATACRPPGPRRSGGSAR